MDKLDREHQLAAWLEGELSDEEATKLRAELEEDPSFRKAAAKDLVLRRMLAQQQIPRGDFATEVVDQLRTDDEESLTSGVIVELQKHQGRQRGLLWGSVGLAVAAMLVLALFVTAPDPRGVRVLAAEGVGTLDTDALRAGKTVRLQRGILELDLAGEARAVVEAPAEFRVLSAQHIQLDSGRCFAEMKEGKTGLRIETPAGEALDLGTKFAVEVPSSEEMSVHVFDGEVEVSDGASTTRLNEGEGLMVEKAGTQRVVAESSLFIPHVPKSSGALGGFLHWSFDEAGGTRVAAQGSLAGRGLANGELIDGPEFVPGVRGHAVSLNGTNQWVKTGHPGISGNRDRTVACWIRIPEQWDSRHEIPLIAWGLKVSQGGPGQAWILALGRSKVKDQKIFGRLRLNVGGRGIFGTTNLRDGRWHHVAAVAIQGQDGPSVLLYVDGQLENVTRNRIRGFETDTANADSEPIQFGRRLFLGGQFMRGAMDEVYIVESALSGDQIRDLMQGQLPKDESEVL